MSVQATLHSAQGQPLPDEHAVGLSIPAFVQKPKGLVDLLREGSRRTVFLREIDAGGAPRTGDAQLPEHPEDRPGLRSSTDLRRSAALCRDDQLSMVDRH